MAPRSTKCSAPTPLSSERRPRSVRRRLLVKLVDAADDLSVQIHPSDTDPSSRRGRKRKTRGLVHHRRGTRSGPVPRVSRRRVTARHRDGDRSRGQTVDALMSFVPVSPGDVFLIEPGTPHAIGKGVLLLEPQRVSPGKRGITYRYWDWNRRYDATGRLDPSGQPRALHRERALGVTNWEGPRGDALSRSGAPSSGASSDGRDREPRSLVGDDGPIRSEVFPATPGRLGTLRASAERSLALAYRLGRTGHASRW